jgi:hypothetical protein
VRLAQPFEKWKGATRWTSVWVVPVPDAVPDRIEGRIGSWLTLCSRRLPRRY